MLYSGVLKIPKCLNANYQPKGGQQPPQEVDPPSHVQSHTVPMMVAHIPRIVTHHHQDSQTPSLGQSPIILGMVTRHPQGGHPPSSEQSATISMTIIYQPRGWSHSQESHPPSLKWSPDILREVTHHPLSSQPPSKGRSSTSPRMVTFLEKSHTILRKITHHTQAQVQAQKI